MHIPDSVTITFSRSENTHRESGTHSSVGIAEAAAFGAIAVAAAGRPVHGEDEITVLAGDQVREAAVEYEGIGIIFAEAGGVGGDGANAGAVAAHANVRLPIQLHTSGRGWLQVRNPGANLESSILAFVEKALRILLADCYGYLYQVIYYARQHSTWQAQARAS